MLRTNLQTVPVRVVSIILFSLAVVLTHTAQAQTFSVLHAFTNGGDGGSPTASLTFDGAGNLYGTASTGGAGNGGTVFQLKRSGQGWTLNTIHAFEPSDGDGETPLGGVVVGPDGTLFGTTAAGGTGCDGGCGMVYNLKPPGSFCHTGVCPWTETILHNFGGYPNDGGQPRYMSLIFDASGDMYGTTCEGGGVNYGTVFEMKPSNGGWTESELYVFDGGDGECPQSGVIMDQAGNLYGTVFQAFENQGEVYEISPGQPYWTQTILERFEEGVNGSAPVAGLVADRSGNFYGMTLSGVVFELSFSGGEWNYSQIYSLPGGGGYGTLAIDAAGNLYGTQFYGTFGEGAAFELARTGGNWTYINLHNFDLVDGGGWPYGGVALDADGNLYGTTSQGGYRANGCGYWGCGYLWEITP
jgi:uncharacterized repeat protein (TIGR03803 family)